MVFAVLLYVFFRTGGRPAAEFGTEGMDLSGWLCFPNWSKAGYRVRIRVALLLFTGRPSRRVKVSVGFRFLPPTRKNIRLLIFHKSPPPGIPRPAPRQFRPSIPPFLLSIFLLPEPLRRTQSRPEPTPELFPSPTSFSRNNPCAFLRAVQERLRGSPASVPVFCRLLVAGMSLCPSVGLLGLSLDGDFLRREAVFEGL